MRPRPLTAGALACLMLVAASAACSGSGSGSDASTTAHTKAARTVTRKLDGPGCQYIVAGTESRSTPAGDTLQYLTSAVTEPTECYDKIMFEFDPGNGPDVPPGYTVEYRKPPFVEGIKSSTEGFDDAKYVLYVELRPVSTKDTRASARGVTTYKGNLRLAFVPDKPGQPGMVHTTIVEWLDKAPPSVPGASTATTTSSTTTTSTTTPDQAGQAGGEAVRLHHQLHERSDHDIDDARPDRADHHHDPGTQRPGNRARRLADRAGLEAAVHRRRVEPAAQDQRPDHALTRRRAPRRADQATSTIFPSFPPATKRS